MPFKTRWVRIAMLIGVMAAAAMLLLAFAQARGASAQLVSAMSSVLTMAFAAVGIVVAVGLAMPGEADVKAKPEADDAALADHRIPLASINIIGNGSDNLDFKLDHDGVSIKIAGGARIAAGVRRSGSSPGTGLDQHHGERQEADDPADEQQNAERIRQSPVPLVEA